MIYYKKKIIFKKMINKYSLKLCTCLNFSIYKYNLRMKILYKHFNPNFYPIIYVIYNNNIFEYCHEIV